MNPTAKKQRVVVHMRPDLDAATCVALAGVAIEDVHFIPAGLPVLPPICPCCGVMFDGTERVLDVQAGGKGVLDADGTRHAACASMPEARETDPRLIAEVDEFDSTGKNEPRFTLNELLSAVKVYCGSEGNYPTSYEYDRAVLRMFVPLLRGLTTIHKQALEAKLLLASGKVKPRIVQLGGYPFLVNYNKAVHPSVVEALKLQGKIVGSIYRQAPHNMGVCLLPGHEKDLDLSQLREHLPEGWFFHTAGFLVCWGSHKSPAKVAPPKGSPKTFEAFIELLREVFSNPEAKLPPLRSVFGG